MTQKNSLLIWNRAIPLSLAYLRFATEAQQEAYREAAKTSALSAIIPRLTAHLEASSGLSDAEKWKGAMTPEVIGNPGAALELRNRLIAQTLTWIRTGQLRAFGYAEPRRPADSPIEVPGDLWSGIVSWEKDLVERHGLKVAAVRLIPSVWLQDNSEPKRPGRPSRIDEISAAYESLKSTGRIDFKNLSLKAAAMLVSEHAQMLNPNHPEAAKGLQHLAVQKVIRDDFFAMKLAISKI
jgi:hypothetical protein